MSKVIVRDGVIIHNGEWDYRLYDIEHVGNPYAGEGDPPDDWDYQVTLERGVIGNPMPEDAQELDIEPAITDKGRMVLPNDWFSLREDAYPSLKDQLDAMWKGGEAAQDMAALVQSIKDRYPKTEAS
ncbi:hypothetical protein D3C76_513850 [compost metagenome]